MATRRLLVIYWIFIYILAPSPIVAGAKPLLPKLTNLTSNTKSLLQAISVVDSQTLWVSGHDGVLLVSHDGGNSWQKRPVANSEKLQFRDLYALNAQTVWAMSAGSGELSRIYKTTDGGKSWRLQFLNKNPKGFLDCLAFWNSEEGIAYGDSINGQLFILLTKNGGESWQRIPAARLPPALANEGGFAASGTCVNIHKNKAWIGTGAGSSPRVLISEDKGASWKGVIAPIVQGKSAGITSILFTDQKNGIILGGDLNQKESKTANVAQTIDGGLSWISKSSPTFPGAIYGGDYFPSKWGNRLFAVGPKGMDYSTDDGKTWYSLSKSNYWAISFASANLGWAVT